MSKSENNLHYRYHLSDFDEDEEDEEKGECQNSLECSQCLTDKITNLEIDPEKHPGSDDEEKIPLPHSLDTDDEEYQDDLTKCRLKIAQDLNEMNNVFLRSQLTDEEIRKLVQLNYTTECQRLTEQYHELFDAVSFEDPIKIETYALLVKLGILEQVKATHDDLYEPSKIKL